MSTEHKHLVGPVVRGFDPDIVDAMTAAIEKDNPGAELFIDDNAGYVRIHAPRVLRVTRSSLSEALGRPIDLPSLEPAIALRRRRHAHLVPHPGGLMTPVRHPGSRRFPPTSTLAMPALRMVP
jgi:toluene monooxygenase system protein D